MTRVLRKQPLAVTNLWGEKEEEEEESREEKSDLAYSTRSLLVEVSSLSTQQIGLLVGSRRRSTDICGVVWCVA